MIKHRYTKYNSIKTDYWFEKIIKKEYGTLVVFQRYINSEYYKYKTKYNKLSPIQIEKIESNFKHKCKICDFYTNQDLLFERHLNSNNHFIRKTQF